MLGTGFLTPHSLCRTCLLGPDTNTTTLCVYAYFIAGISILATIIVALFLVCPGFSACIYLACLCDLRLLRLADSNKAVRLRLESGLGACMSSDPPSVDAYICS